MKWIVLILGTMFFIGSIYLDYKWNWDKDWRDFCELYFKDNETTDDRSDDS